MHTFRNFIFIYIEIIVNCGFYSSVFIWKTDYISQPMEDVFGSSSLRKDNVAVMAITYILHGLKIIECLKSQEGPVYKYTHVYIYVHKYI